MRREALLVGAATAVLALSAVLATLAPGAIARPQPDEPPGRVALSELNVQSGQVGGRTVDLHVDARIEHRGGPTENASLELRAVDLDTGFVAESRTLSVSRATGDRELSVAGNLSVERSGGYRIEALLFVDGERVASGHRRVEGVGTLQPEYARTPVEFHRFERAALPVVEFSISDADENRTRLDVTTYLTNAGDSPAGDLELVVKARQADSGIVADRRTVQVGSIAPGRTARPSATLAVPDGYNYYLDAVLWKDDVVVGTVREAATLDPTETVPVNETTREVGLDVGEFEQDGAGAGAGAESPRRTSAGGQPGFGVGAAVIAVAAAALLLGRRYA